MAIEQMTMPQLGESVTEGTISKWLVAPGDKVNKYDPIAEVMTDKVNAEVPSSFTGTITELVGEEGQTLQVGEMICKIETEGANPAEQNKNSQQHQKPLRTLLQKVLEQPISPIKSATRQLFSVWPESTALTSIK